LTDYSPSYNKIFGARSAWQSRAFALFQDNSGSTKGRYSYTFMNQGAKTNQTFLNNNWYVADMGNWLYLNGV
jgi:hypothetical protein